MASAEDCLESDFAQCYIQGQLLDRGSAGSSVSLTIMQNRQKGSRMAEAHACEEAMRFSSFVFILVLLAMTGCNSGAPRTRLGALPFPGLLTLYTLADPNDLGVARYESGPRLVGDERSRGILYTKRAGFLDLAHVREAMDWTWYANQNVAAALREHTPEAELAGIDGCTFRIFFKYPDDWDMVENAEKEAVVNELSRRIGGTIAFHAMTWHEIITWFDYRTTLIVSEKGSAFTYEDTASHLIGIIAADVAIRNSTGSWNHDATAALNNTLVKMEVVSAKDASVAVKLVEGKWWKNGVCVRRNIDLGNGLGEVQPWVVRGAPWGDVAAETLRLPALTNVLSRDYVDFWEMQIEPSILIPNRVLKVSELPSHAIDPRVHFPILMNQIKDDMKRELGPQVDQPYDD